MTKLFNKFNDGTNYSVKLALDTFDKGSHRLLVVTYNEALRAVNNRAPDTLLNIAQRLAGRKAAFSTFSAIVSVLTDDTVRLNNTDDKIKVQFTPEKKGGTVVNTEYAGVVADYIRKGRGIFNDAMLEALRLSSSETKPIDLDKRFMSLVKAARKEGLTDLQIIDRMKATMSAMAEKATAPVMDTKAETKVIKKVTSAKVKQMVEGQVAENMAATS